MNEQTTSVAKDVQLESYEEHLLSKYDEISQHFNEQGAQGQELVEDKREEEQQSGSSMITEDASTHEMRPSPEMANEQDRLSFNNKWQAEKENADAKNEYAEHLVEVHGKENGNSAEPSQDYDYDCSR